MNRSVALLIAALLFGIGPANAGQLSPGLVRLIEGRSGSEEIKVLVVLEDQAPLRTIDEDLDRSRASFAGRHRAVVDALRAAASRSQSSLLEALEEARQAGRVRGYTPYWILNAITVTASIDHIRGMAARNDVEVIEPDLEVELIEPVESREGGGIGLRGIGVTPGLVAIEAPRVWEELRIRGVGALVGNMDTGVSGTHESLAARWRGNFAPASECWRDGAGYGDLVPVDRNSHGTHVMGTICGLAPGDTIGVAPGALWIADNTINQAGGIEFDNDVLTGLQWFADPDSNSTTTEDVPDVVQHSWGVHEGISDYVDCDSRWWTAIDNCEAAGVVNVWAAGNDGPNPSTIESPADRAASPWNTFSVGATQAIPPYTIAGFSSRGPSGCGGADSTKPEVVAPGENIYSADVLGAYRVASGTSMAGPHVAGIVALMRSANPDLTVDAIKEILLSTSVDLGPEGEDDSYGRGFVNAYEAVLASIAGFGWIEGTVTDIVSGLPVANVLVDLVNDPRSTTTDANGFYRIPLPEGSWSLEFSAFGYDMAPQAFDVFADLTTDGSLALTPAPTAIVNGIVLDVLGAPVDSATILVLDRPIPPVSTLPDGSFTLTVPDGASYDVRARKNGYGSQTHTVVVADTTSQNFTLPELTAEDFESGDFEMWPWTHSGASAWTIDSSTKQEGLFSARSGPVAQGQTSSLEIEVFLNEAQDVTFWTQVSSKAGSDALRFFMDGALVSTWSGILPWTQSSFPVTPGQHTMRWSYSRSSVLSYGDDAAWIDFVELPEIGVPSYPNIGIFPDTLSAEIEFDETFLDEILITNGGQANLNFTASVQEIPGAFHGPLEETSLRGSGGPDAFGYRFFDSDDPSGPLYEWVEINSVGTVLVMHNDTYTLPKALGFPFPFYENTYPSVRISTNGFVSFTAPAALYAANDSIPSASNPNNVVAAFWDDLDADESGKVYTYQDIANSRFIIEWDGVSINGSNGALPQTFQIILHADGRIVMQYKWVSNAAGCTVGIENAGGTDGLAAAFNESYLHNEMAILFSNASPVSWLQVTPISGTVPPLLNDGIGVSYGSPDLRPGSYEAFIRIVSNDPDTPVLNVPVSLTVTGPTGVNNGIELPTHFALQPPHPNPFDATTSIHYAVPEDGRSVALTIYDVSGRLVRTLVKGDLPAGRHASTWDARDERGRRVTSGIYFCRMSADDFTQVRKITLLK